MIFIIVFYFANMYYLSFKWDANNHKPALLKILKWEKLYFMQRRRQGET